MFFSAVVVALAAQAYAEAPPTHGSDQLVVVTTASWTATTGRLQRYQRGAASTGGAFVKVGAAIDVVVGDGGLGWGIGVHEFASGPADPKKMEGDGRAPADVFRLTSVLGKVGVPATKMAKHVIEAGDVCVDDVTSGLYNRVLAPPPPEKSWNSAEKMLRERDALYDLVVVVDHNHAVDSVVGERPIKGRGSCVFLHVWRRPNSPTVGCTAMTQNALTDVVMWLDPAQQPLLVQLPRDVYARVREPWALP